MALRRKKNQKMGRGGRIALGVLAALALLIVLVCGVGAVNAGIVRIRRATVEIPDLPPAFDGRTILFASDIDLCGINTPAKSGALFEKLQSLRPDMLILGGDYASASLLEILNKPEERDVDGTRALVERLHAEAVRALDSFGPDADFFRALADDMVGRTK